VDYIHANTECSVLLDVKRGDIGSTAMAYAQACYDGLEGEGVTLSPLMGWDSVEPFVTGKYSNKGAFILCKTSNPGSNDLLALSLQDSTLYEKIATLSNTWSQKAESTTPSSSSSSSDPPRLGLVVGATDPQALAKARAAAGPNIWILAPGVGAQGGDLDAACMAGLNDEGTGMLIPVSRGISRASDPGEEAKRLKEGINAARERVLVQRKSSDNSSSSSSSIAPYQKEFIEFSLKEQVLRFGSFVLKSGRTSPYFFNAGLFSSGSALFKLGKAYAASIMASDQLVDSNGKVTFDIVFGPAYKGISLGALVCSALYADYGVESGFTYNRKEAKDHGEGGILVGASIENKRILIVDDVITAGTAIRESFDMLKKYNATPVGVSIALDRAEKRSLDDPLSAVQAVARDLEIPVVSIVALPQLHEFLRSSSDYGEDVLKQVSEYRAQYGV
jgi:orotidine 5'-phosphate decarboxylase subfamily 2